MAPYPISTLKKGLAQFSKKIKARKDKLMDMLAKNEKISDDDEHWLDHEANTVDEQHVLDILEAASDYEKEVGRLDANSKGFVKKLWELSELVPTSSTESRIFYHVIMRTGIYISFSFASLLFLSCHLLIDAEVCLY